MAASSVEPEPAASGHAQRDIELARPLSVYSNGSGGGGGSASVAGLRLETALNDLLACRESASAKACIVVVYGC